MSPSGGSASITTSTRRIDIFFSISATSASMFRTIPRRWRRARFVPTGIFSNPSGKEKFSHAIRRFPAANASVSRMYYHTPELGAEFIRRLYGEMDVTLTQEIRQATDWLANGKFAICFFCSEILKVKAQGLPVDEFRTAKWKESRAISAGNMGSIVSTEPAAAPERRARIRQLVALARRSDGASARDQHAVQFRRIAAHRYPQGHGAQRSTTRRRREIYTGG